MDSVCRGFAVGFDRGLRLSQGPWLEILLVEPKTSCSLEAPLSEGTPADGGNGSAGSPPQASGFVSKHGSGLGMEVRI